jgi:hypothetical protein
LMLNRFPVCRFAALMAMAAVSLLSPGVAGDVPHLTDTSTVGYSPRYVVAIERITVDDMKLHDTLDILLTTNGMELGGFDFKFGMPGSIAEIVEVLPGELIDSCGWEYFHAAPVRTDTSGRYPDILWQAVGLARMMPSDSEPRCFGSGGPVSLMRLVVSSGEMFVIPDTTIPVFFFWEDCTDNTISGVRGDTISFSSAVIDYFPVDLAEAGGVFPTRFGAPRQCDKPGMAGRNRRQTVFHNGGIEFRLDLGSEADDTSGAE